MRNGNEGGALQAAESVQVRRDLRGAAQLQVALVKHGPLTPKRLAQTLHDTYEQEARQGDCEEILAGCVENFEKISDLLE